MFKKHLQTHLTQQIRCPKGLMIILRLVTVQEMLIIQYLPHHLLLDPKDPSAAKAAATRRRVSKIWQPLEIPLALATLEARMES